jgi:hypothetical protein
MLDLQRHCWSLEPESYALPSCAGPSVHNHLSNVVPPLLELCSRPEDGGGRTDAASKALAKVVGAVTEVRRASCCLPGASGGSANTLNPTCKGSCLPRFVPQLPRHDHLAICRLWF